MLELFSAESLLWTTDDAPEQVSSESPKIGYNIDIDYNISYNIDINYNIGYNIDIAGYPDIRAGSPVVRLSGPVTR